MTYTSTISFLQNFYKSIESNLDIQEQEVLLLQKIHESAKTRDSQLLEKIQESIIFHENKYQDHFVSNLGQGLRFASFDDEDTILEELNSIEIMSATLLLHLQDRYVQKSSGDNSI